MNEFSFKEDFHFEHSDFFNSLAKSLHNETNLDDIGPKIEGLPKVQKFIFAFCFIAMFFFGLFANMIVIIVYIAAKKFKKNSNLLINLCVTDILILIVCMPIALADLFSVNGEWFYGVLYCKMYYFIEFCITLVSSLTIIVISVERYLCLFLKSSQVK
jgi:hypothetical protein